MKRIGVVGIPGGWSTERLADAVKRRTGFRMVIDLARSHLDLDAGRVVHAGWDLLDLDAVVVKKIAGEYRPEHLDRLELLRFVAERGVPVFSNPRSIIRVLDRLTCTVTLRLHGIPMPPTVITEDIDEAAAAVERFGKVVCKPLFSSKARGMRVIEPGPGMRDAIRDFQDSGHPVMYIQKFMDLPGKDLALAFLGGEYLGAYARVGGRDSWNTTTRSGGAYCAAEPGRDIIELARKAQEPFGLDFTSVDVAECEDGPVVFEVSAFGGFRGLLKGCDIDAAARYTDYVLDKLHGLTSVRAWQERLGAKIEVTEHLDLCFQQCRIGVCSNSRRLMEKLAYYYKEFPGEAGQEADVVVTAVEATPPNLGLEFTVKPPDPGKSKIKEEYVDFPDGRIVRKRLTGMHFLFGRDCHLAYGPCVQNDNQVVNFINNRYIQWCLNRGYLLCHAAAVSSGERGLALAGFSGMGKSTLALALMSRGLNFVSNDRLMIQRNDRGLHMLGVPKLPRVNPGTILHNDALRQVMPAAEREKISRLAPEELWSLEQKYDVFIDQCFGPGRFRLQAGMRGLVILNWKREGSALRIQGVDLRKRDDLLEAFMKNVGLFYESDQDFPDPDFSPALYLDSLEGCPVFELTGGTDFDAAADACRAFLEHGTMGS